MREVVFRITAPTLEELQHEAREALIEHLGPAHCTFHDGSNPPGLTMKVIVDLCVVPIGVGVHLAPYIAACEKVLSEAGLKIQLHPNGTAIEGEWEPVFNAIEACHQAVHAMGCPRVYTTVKINTRTDRDQTLEDKVASVQALL